MSDLKDKTTKTPWTQKDILVWFEKQSIKRSYLEEVVNRIEGLKETFVIDQYGALSYAPEKYPLFLMKNKNWDDNKKTILITGGVHGYETSGVHGALLFLESKAAKYEEHFNFVVAPCVSPWGYETINRWNPNAVDPNRSFYANSPSEESTALMSAVKNLGVDIFSHIDLHETTDTDNTEFLPALAARDGKELVIWEIPDGFYVVGDTDNPVDDFQQAIIQSVKKVTHIAEADKEGNIIGEKATQEGVINYPKKTLFLCAGFSNSQYPTTTEVYPDSSRTTPEECCHAQVAAIVGGLDYLLKNK